MEEGLVGISNRMTSTWTDPTPLPWLTAHGGANVSEVCATQSHEVEASIPPALQCLGIEKQVDQPCPRSQHAVPYLVQRCHHTSCHFAHELQTTNKLG
jgi:hypothetical protein